MHNLFKNVAIGLSTDIAAGSTVVYGDIIDTMGYNGVAFAVTFGTITTAATNGMHVEMADTTATTDMIDVEGSGTTGGGDDPGDAKGGLCLVDCGRPRKRYYRAAVDRATANSVVNGILNFLYNPVHAAVTHSTAAGFLVRGSTFLNFATTGASTGS